MPRPLFPNLCHEAGPGETPRWYVRVVVNGQRRKIRLRAPFGTDEFKAQYLAAMSGEPSAQASKSKVAAGSLAWLIERYREACPWLILAPATRYKHEKIFTQVLKTAGDKRAASISQKHIVEGRDRRAHTPHQARHFLDAMRGLFEWAATAQHVKVDPTAGVKAPKTPKSGGFKIWTEEELQRYEARWPLGTRQRVWLDVLLYTGLRRSDAVRLGRQHVRPYQGRPEATLRTVKGQGEVEVTIPILPVLQATLDAGPTAELAFICGLSGKQLTAESFGNLFKDACREAKVDAAGKAAHGLRKVAATRVANSGASVHDMMALFGWRTEKEALVYTKEADRRRGGRRAGGALAGTPEEQPVAPAPEIPGPLSEKPQ